MLFPDLKISLRSREFDTYLMHERSQVIYEYLFNGRSHRWLDANVLNQDADISNGWQSMGILHRIWLINSHKGFFKNYSLREAIAYLETNDSVVYKEVVDHLRLYFSTSQPPQ